MADYHCYIQALTAISGEIDVSYDEPMSAHTTMRVGGPADVFLCPHSAHALAFAVSRAQEQEMPYVVIGGGSNLLVPDAGIRGVVLCTALMQGIIIEDTTIKAEAGVKLSALARAAMNAGLSGVEFAAGIPGTLGGALFMNAGAYGGEIADVARETIYYDEMGARQACGGQMQGFGYRTSAFRSLPICAIAGATLALTCATPEEVRAKIIELSERRREKQPLDYPSAGSIFKRPTGHFAGQLIEEAGLKGHSIGGAQISEKHAGFIINRGSATCADVCALIALAQESVLRQCGVALECEVRIL